MSLSIIILAAGQGTRMRSSLPKVLHPVGGKPLLQHVLDTASSFATADIHVVIGHGADQVREQFAQAAVHWVVQAEQLGTGHAVAQVLPDIPRANTVLVMYGDVPLVRRQTLDALHEIASQGDAVGLLTAHLEAPAGYGRILHDGDGNICGIVEEKDATEIQRRIREINTGFIAAPAGRLHDWVASLENDNASGEYYLTDVIALAVRDGVAVRGVSTKDPDETLGVNDRVQLARLERDYQQRQASDCLQAGVTLIDPARFDLRGRLDRGIALTREAMTSKSTSSSSSHG